MDELYKIQNVTYNATGGTLKNDKVVIDLTAQQNRLLRYLILNTGQTLTKEQITAHVWGYDVDSDVSNLIYDTVSAVRRLLKKAGLNGAVTTKTGIGYAFTERKNQTHSRQNRRNMRKPAARFCGKRPEIHARYGLSAAYGRQYV